MAKKKEEITVICTHHYDRNKLLEYAKIAHRIALRIIEREDHERSGNSGPTPTAK